MQVLIVNFKLNGMTHDELVAAATEHGPVFRDGVPGLIEKVFLDGEESGIYGGVYKFEDRPSLDTYLASEIWAGVKADPRFAELTARTFGVVEEPTRQARGMAQVGVA